MFLFITNSSLLDVFRSAKLKVLYIAYCCFLNAIPLQRQLQLHNVPHIVFLQSFLYRNPDVADETRVSTQQTSEISYLQWMLHTVSRSLAPTQYMLEKIHWNYHKQWHPVFVSLGRWRNETKQLTENSVLVACGHDTVWSQWR